MSEIKTKESKGNVVLVYLIAVSFVALACGFSENILANYYKDAYDITAVQRGFIEIPREFPGVIAVFVLAFLARLGDIKIAAIAQGVAMFGITILAFWTPNFYMMTAVLFIYSMGIHMYLPLQDSLAISIFSAKKDGQLGKHIGNVKGVYTAFGLVASIIVFLGFRYDVLSFKTDIKLSFVLAGICFAMATMLLIYLNKCVTSSIVSPPKIIIRKEYKYYYLLATMHGVQKQVVIVYAPWVIIDMLNQGADTMSVLLILSSILGIFFMPFLGKCLDKFGIRTMLYADAWSFIGVYLAFAYMVFNLSNGNFSTAGVAAIITCGIFIIDRMSNQMGFIRTVYLNNIALDKSEVMPTISFGMSLDHVIAITCSYLSGWVWETFGAHYIFLFAAFLSLVNLIVARIAPIQENK